MSEKPIHADKVSAEPISTPYHSNDDDSEIEMVETKDGISVSLRMLEDGMVMAGTTFYLRSDQVRGMAEWLSLRVAPSAGVSIIPSDNDGKEQDAFEAWAKANGFDMRTHPLHWLFLDKRTYAARDGWRGALQYVAKVASSTPSASVRVEEVERVLKMLDSSHVAFTAGTGYDPKKYSSHFSEAADLIRRLTDRKAP